MKAVGDLDRGGRSLSTTFRVRASAISDDDLDAWVMLKPVGEHVGRAIVEHVDRSVRFEIDQNGRTFTAASVMLRNCRKSVSGLTGTPALRANRAPPSPPACNANVVSRSSATAVRCAYRASVPFDAFGKDLPWASRHIAEPAAAMYPQMNHLPAPREIKRMAFVATVRTRAELAALGTRNRQPSGFDDTDQAAVALDHDQDDAPTLRCCPTRLGHRDSPPWHLRYRLHKISGRVHSTVSNSC
jgi:hypothetical protein